MSEVDPQSAHWDPYDYPKHWEADVVLSDGGTVHLRPITPDDADRIVAMHSRMSEQTRYFRFFTPYPRIPERDLKRFSVVDHHGRVALGAFLGDDLIAVGRYERLGDTDSAEVAFVVEDAHQGCGLGSILLEHLAAAARERGLTRFVAEVLADNNQMVGVFRDAGYQVSRELDAGVLHLEFAVDPTEKSVAVSRAREQAAEARSMYNLLHPRSVAVIGASTDPSKIGYAVLSNLLSANFAGPVYPVNSEHRSVRGVRAYASVVDIPDPVDLAVVAIPASGVDEVMDACLAKGVTTLVVLSSGFADAGPDGRSAERRLVAEARAHGMRVVGPNALGVVNNDPAVRLNATLAPRLPGTGRAGFFCQSGALGIGILADAAARGLGLSTFVSAGNRADVSGNDLLQYWQTDPATQVVLLYLESFGNPRKFARLARRLARHKPVAVVRSGRHAMRPGLAASSVPIDEESVQALFEQSGVIRVESLAQLFDTALLLVNQPLPANNRVAVVGNSTAIGMLAADTVLASGLRLAFDPVDTGSQASPEEFGAAVRATMRRDDVDAGVIVFVPPLAVPGTAYARTLREVVADLAAQEGVTGKPIVSTFLAVEGVPAELAVPGPSGTPGYGSVPSYPSPERAVQALARAARYARWRSAPLGQAVRPPGIELDGARRVIASAGPEVDEESGGVDRSPWRRELSAAAAARLLRCYGVELVAGPADTAPGADSVPGADAVACAVGLQDDPSFGSLVYFGLSGIVSDLLGDRAYRAVPLTDKDAANLVREPRAAPLLTGYRGARPVDLAALEDLTLRVAALAEDLPEIRGVALDPVIASAAGVAVAAARITVGAPPPRPDLAPRRLRSIGGVG
jgi:acyl-CoA synthetase (NDP forming)/GNAT superfamily N-acetyltransferase